MDRCSIHVDAGHLLAEGGKLCCGTRKRQDFRFHHARLVDYIEAFATDKCGLPALRTYWYDGAYKAIPTAEHLQIGELPGVKVRLGRVSGGKQKGVDALIYRDLMTLARERAIATAYLVAGDEDLREGVAAAQDLGVRVIVLGIESYEGENQSESLVREADEHYVLNRSDLKDFFFRSNHDPGSPAMEMEDGAGVSGTRVATCPKVTSQSPTGPNAEEEVRSAAHGYTRHWVERAQPSDVAALTASRPRIPREVDGLLLRHVEQSVGSLRDQEVLRRVARSSFWKCVDDLGDPPS